MFKGSSAILLIACLFAMSCDRSEGTRSNSAGPRTISSEELRLWSIGKFDINIANGQKYRVIGKIYSINMSDDGVTPLVWFTGMKATFLRDFDRSKLEALVPKQYVAVDCDVEKDARDVWTVLRRCERVDDVHEISSDDYEKYYEGNILKADHLFKDKYVVITGVIRRIDKLTTGERYISLRTENWGGNEVLTFMSPEDMRLAADYYKVGERAVMLCVGGWRWNLVKEVGLKNCRVLAT